MNTSLEIKRSQHTGRVPVTVFELAGEVDSSTAEQFQKEIQQAIEAGAQYVLLDFRRLNYISSAGVRSLFRLIKTLSAADKEVAAHGGVFKSPHLKLLSPTNTVRQTLDLMGFTMSMEIHDDLQQAVDSF